MRLASFPRALLTTVLVACTAAAAHATEIPPPEPLGADLGPLDARALLARWTGRSAPTSTRELVSVVAAPVGDRPSDAIVDADGEPALAPPMPHGRNLAPRPLLPPAPHAGDGGYDVFAISVADAAGGPSIARVGDGAPGSTRFDVRPSASNPITIGGDALDAFTARVVRTPEPGTLALFALGALGLATALARRRRRA